MYSSILLSTNKILHQSSEIISQIQIFLRSEMRACNKARYLSEEQQNSLDLSCKSFLTETIWGQTLHCFTVWL